MGIFDEPSKHSLPKEPQFEDHRFSIIKGSIAAIPFLGGALAEELGLLLTPTLARRRDEWFDDLARRLRELEDRIDGFRLVKLGDEEQFVSVVVQATQSAIRTHETEKLQALRNAVVNFDFFKFVLPSASRVRFALQSLDAFRGWVFLYIPNSSAWLQYAYVGTGGTSQMDVDLPAGTWVFSVSYDNDSTPGKYQLLVYPTTRWPSDLTAPNPSSSSQGVETFATPPLPIELRGKTGLTARFWLEGS